MNPAIDASMLHSIILKFETQRVRIDGEVDDNVISRARSGRNHSGLKWQCRGDREIEIESLSQIQRFQPCTELGIGLRFNRKIPFAITEPEARPVDGDGNL